MAVGFPKNKAAVDSFVGEISVSINRDFRRAQQFKIELDSVTDAQLTAAGYTAGEITTLRTLATDLELLADIYTGAANLALAKDFRPSLRPVWGVLGDL